MLIPTYLGDVAALIVESCHYCALHNFLKQALIIVLIEACLRKNNSLAFVLLVQKALTPLSVIKFFQKA